VETDRPGFTASLIATRVLGESWPTSAIFLDNVTVPIDHLVGAEGQGFQIAMNALDYGRLVVGARCVGIGQAALDEMTQYSQERHAFGQPIGKFQQIQAHIANTAVEIEAARLMIYRLAMTLERSGTSQPRLSSQAKYYAAEVAYRAAERAFEIFGGYAVTDDYPIARHLNTAALLRTGEGSANLQRVLIAEDILGYRSSDRYRVEQKFPLWRAHDE
jgi:alkylation response protein AidB-like acyl-CoA dehydrogenase